MARNNQKLINYHGTDKNNLSATSLSLGEIAVVHNTAEPLLGTKVDDKVVFFASSGAVATAIDSASNTVNERIDNFNMAVSGNGKPIVAVSQASGQVAAIADNIKAQYVTVADTAGKLEATNVEDALAELANKAAAITIANADGSINVTSAATGTDINVNIKTNDAILAKDGGNGVYSTLNLIKITSGLPATVKERYELQGINGAKIGEDIDVPKDSHIVSITYNEATQKLIYKYLDASGVEQTTEVDMAHLILETEVENGIQTVNGKLSIKLDTTGDDTGDNKFLTVGANGLKLDGVTNAIAAAVDALDYTDTAATGRYVATVNETNGVVSVTRANVSDAVLNGYEKGTKPASTALAATDDVKGALAKLEHQIDDAKAAATTKVEKDVNAAHLTLTSDSAADGSVTYTIGENDIASASALTQEISDRATAITNLSAATVDAIEAEKTVRENQDNTIEASVGLADNGSHVATNGNYTSAATTVVGEIAALDTALKAVSDKLNSASVAKGTSKEDFVKLDVTSNGGATAITIDDTVLSGKLATIDTALDAEIADREDADEAIIGTSEDADTALTLNGLKKAIEKAAAASKTEVVEGTDNPHLTISSSAGTSGQTVYTITLDGDVASTSATTQAIATAKSEIIGDSEDISSDNTIYGLRAALAEVKAGLVDSISGDNTLISATTTSGADGETVTISATQKLTDAVAKAEVAPTSVAFGELGSVTRDEHNSGVNATIDNNTLTLDLDELVVDCGTF